MGPGSCAPDTGSSTTAADRYLPVPGALLRYRDEGHGAAVLLVHGWTLDLDMWEPQVSALAATFRVIRFDRRGFGLSTGSPSTAADARDVLALCRHLQLGKVACVGMSQGARVALQLCRIAPELISCGVLDGPPDLVGTRGDQACGNQERADVPLSEYRMLIAQEGVEGFRRLWQAHPLMQLHTDDGRSRQLLRRMIARYPGRDLVQEPASVNSSIEDHWDVAALASVRIPFLVISGEHDLSGRHRAADELAKLLPFAERTLIAGAGHLPNLDQPRQYNAVLKAFLERHLGAHV
jgi:3-oxoadipate enol-lactonase